MVEYASSKTKTKLRARRVAVIRKRGGSVSGIPAVIFDGDDTLWETMPLYTTAKIGFQRLMAAESLDSVRALEEFEKIDKKNVERLGFSRQRLPTSMSETYRLLCSEKGQSLNGQVQIRIREIANRIFEGQARLVPGAECVLEALCNFRLILLTKGDPAVQRKRTEESGLANYFDSIYIVPSKQEAEFQSIIQKEEIDKQASWSVGDSLRSDVHPALKVGLNAIWIPTSTWSYEVESVRPEQERLHICKSLSEIPLILT
jgi:putative hydrolase of the HAD superfamily